MSELRIRDLPDDLHKELKLICVRKDISMNNLVKTLIEKFIEENKSK